MGVAIQDGGMATIEDEVPKRMFDRGVPAAGARVLVGGVCGTGVCGAPSEVAAAASASISIGNESSRLLVALANDSIESWESFSPAPADVGDRGLPRKPREGCDDCEGESAPDNM
mmetsp:Transcript_20714/g.45494  ORF Transcript_20714/g.45494 Transcript_20714/m.45494 type:complete len:115 (+) Transcript_20714:926-1270(+)